MMMTLDDLRKVLTDIVKHEADMDRCAPGERYSADGCVHWYTAFTLAGNARHALRNADASMLISALDEAADMVPRAVAQWLAELLVKRSEWPCDCGDVDCSIDIGEVTACEDCPRYIADAAGWIAAASKATGQTPAQPSDMVPRAALTYAVAHYDKPCLLCGLQPCGLAEALDTQDNVLACVERRVAAAIAAAEAIGQPAPAQE